VLSFSNVSFTIAEPFVFKGGDILAYGTPTLSGAIQLDTTADVDAFRAEAAITLSGPIGGIDPSGRQCPERLRAVAGRAHRRVRPCGLVAARRASFRY
jgi:hypothetical protein